MDYTPPWSTYTIPSRGVSVPLDLDLANVVEAEIENADRRALAEAPLRSFGRVRAQIDQRGVIDDTLCSGFRYGANRIERPQKFPNNEANTMLLAELRLAPCIQAITSFQNAALRAVAPCVWESTNTALEAILNNNCTLHTPFYQCHGQPQPTAFAQPLRDRATVWTERTVVSFPLGSTFLLPAGLFSYSFTGASDPASRMLITQSCDGEMYRFIESGMSFELDIPGIFNSQAEAREDRLLRAGRAVDLFPTLEDFDSRFDSSLYGSVLTMMRADASDLWAMNLEFNKYKQLSLARQCKPASSSTAAEGQQSVARDGIPRGPIKPCMSSREALDFHSFISQKIPNTKALCPQHFSKATSAGWGLRRTIPLSWTRRIRFDGDSCPAPQAPSPASPPAHTPFPLDPTSRTGFYSKGYHWRASLDNPRTVDSRRGSMVARGTTQIRATRRDTAGLSTAQQAVLRSPSTVNDENRPPSPTRRYWCHSTRAYQGSCVRRRKGCELEEAYYIRATHHQDIIPERSLTSQAIPGASGLRSLRNPRRSIIKAMRLI
ncbi:hypothetical protein C8F04DRAFT_1253773 [Mycena alexandri]|uniref:Uncharacterized protein n=1 Tax=Mycena alexandri TaxID=1745969 RepID=A0AAD6TBF5_9AGAR|nr:hypothetical protein C8F04DRAFT_1253773 [Mycena alexandri]